MSTVLNAIAEIIGSNENAKDFGAGCYVVEMSESDISTYNKYLDNVKENGYTLYAENSATPIETYVKTATFTKDNMVCTVTYMVRTGMTYLAVYQDLPLSKHLIFDKSYLADNVEGAKTTLHNLRMHWFGNDIVIQLKNGHFIISDGGLQSRNDSLCDTKILMEYLQKLTPEGEKPIVDAWIFSHLHSDHCGVIFDFADGLVDADELLVEGIYYNEPNEEVFQLDKLAFVEKEKIAKAAELLKTTSGEHPDIYRLQTGQRYYFNDITMDVVLSQEQHPRSEYESLECPNNQEKVNFNESSTLCMFTIEGQKVFFTGDADKGLMDCLMRVYDKDYLTMTAMTTPHHSWNPYQRFVEYITTDVVIVTADMLATSESVPKRSEWYAPNSALQKKVQEVLAWGEGTVVMTFPYTVGTHQHERKDD